MSSSKRLSSFALIACFIVQFSTIAGAGETVWDHNGSKIRWVSDGSKRTAYYLEPRSGIASTGVREGQILFEGTRKGDFIEGYAYTFKRGCSPEKFFVSGSVASERKFVLDGMAPVRAGSGCTSTSTKSVSLPFDFIQPDTASKGEEDMDLTGSIDAARNGSNRDDEDRGIQVGMNREGVTRFLKWTQSDSKTERELLYDSCSRRWNDTSWFKQFNPKYMVAGSRRNQDGSYSGNCFYEYNNVERISSGDAWDETLASVISRCRKVFPNCYLFAKSNVISTWALSEERRLVDQSRFANSNSNSGSGSGGSGGGSSVSLGDLLDIANAVVGGVNAVRGNSGYSGSNSGARIPTPSGYSQKGAFDDCARVYGAAGQEQMAAACKSRSSNMNSLR